MVFRRCVPAVLSVAATLVPAAPAEAARGFSWVHGPATIQTLYVRARWHADYADPRCPNEPHIEAYEEEAHLCGAGFAVIGVWHDDFTFENRGLDNGNVPFDDFTDDVLGACLAEEEPPYTSGPDQWQAFWVQEIHHRADHHDVDPHVSPALVEIDSRPSPKTSPSRCDYTKVQTRAS